MKLSLTNIHTGDNALEVVRIIERLGVTVVSFEHEPARSYLHIEVEGPNADVLLRTRLNNEGLRPDWLSTARVVGNKHCH